MTTLIFTHPDFRLHDTGMGHPESPIRIDTVWDVLGSGDFRQLEQREAPEASGRAVGRRACQGLCRCRAGGGARATGGFIWTPIPCFRPRSRSAILRASGAVLSLRSMRCWARGWTTRSARFGPAATMRNRRGQWVSVFSTTSPSVPSTPPPQAWRQESRHRRFRRSSRQRHSGDGRGRAGPVLRVHP